MSTVLERITKQSRRKAYLEALRNTGLVGVACRTAGVSRTAIHRWREDAGFKERERTVLREWADELEKHAVNLAKQGWTERTTTTDPDGRTTVQEKERRSVPLLLRTLEAHKPRKWSRRSRVEHSGNQSTVNVALQVALLANPAALEAACALDRALASPEPPGTTLELGTTDPSTPGPDATPRPS